VGGERSGALSSQPLFDLIFPDPPIVGHVPLSGSDLRDSGIQSALDHVLKIKSEYVASCLEKIAELKSGTTFTSEDLRDLAGAPPEGCENSIAGILKRAASAKYKLIVITSEERIAKRTTIHAKKLYVWRRL
jgi:hypothetical protein